MSNKQRAGGGAFDSRGNGRGQINFGAPAGQPAIRVNINDLPQIRCNCGGTLFTTGMQLRYSGPLISANGKSTIVQVPSGWVCVNCGQPNNFQYTDELADIIKKPEEMAQPDADVGQPTE